MEVNVIWFVVGNDDDKKSTETSLSRNTVPITLEYLLKETLQRRRRMIVSLTVIHTEVCGLSRVTRIVFLERDAFNALSNSSLLYWGGGRSIKIPPNLGKYKQNYLHG